MGDLLLLTVLEHLELPLVEIADQPIAPVDNSGLESHQTGADVVITTLQRLRSQLRSQLAAVCQHRNRPHQVPPETATEIELDLVGRRPCRTGLKIVNCKVNTQHLVRREVHLGPELLDAV